jgi:hypothetical protein
MRGSKGGQPFPRFVVSGWTARAFFACILREALPRQCRIFPAASRLLAPKILYSPASLDLSLFAAIKAARRSLKRKGELHHDHP